MMSVLKAALAQILCLALVIADFTSPARSEVKAESSMPFASAYEGGRPDSVALSGILPSTPRAKVPNNRQPLRVQHNQPSQGMKLPGQSSTLLPDGRLLLLGGEGQKGPVSTAAILDPTSSAITPLSTALLQPRAWHSATLLPTGKVLIFGGVGTGDTLIATGEMFDPLTGQFAALAPLGLTARSHHTATLLTDGTVFIAGGLDEHNTILGTAQLWDYRAATAINIDGQLITPRSEHAASLQPDGTVL